MRNALGKRKAADKFNYERWLKLNARFELQRPEEKKVLVMGPANKRQLIPKADIVRAISAMMSTQ